jgi:ribosomal protein L13
MHKGQRFHLFDASRIPLGRMARMCAVFIRGKNKPTFESGNPEMQGDICVIVNARKPLVWGKKV